MGLYLDLYQCLKNGLFKPNPSNFKKNKINPMIILKKLFNKYYGNLLFLMISFIRVRDYRYGLINIQTIIIGIG